MGRFARLMDAYGPGWVTFGPSGEAEQWAPTERMAKWLMRRAQGPREVARCGTEYNGEGYVPWSDTATVIGEPADMPPHTVRLILAGCIVTALTMMASLILTMCVLVDLAMMATGGMMASLAGHLIAANVHTYYVDGQATIIVHVAGHTAWLALIVPSLFGGLH